MVSDSGLVVTVPAAEPIVGPHRLRYDQSAAWGVPAHVTVLYPFVPPSLIDDEVLARVASLVAAVPRFTVTFRRAQWFEDRVLWLEPLPGDPFVALTSAVASAFPEYPPYGGEHPSTTPHLTVGDTGTADELALVQRLVEPQLPTWMDVSRVSLITGDQEPHSYRTTATFPLG